MISKIWKFVKEKFFTIAFISFAVIGVVNTVIDLVVNWGVLEMCGGVFFKKFDINANQDGFPYVFSVTLAKALAFTAASVFSYFANAKFTYKVEEKTKKQFFAVFLTYGLRLLCSILLNFLFTELFRVIVSEAFFDKWWKIIPNLASSVVLIPIFFIVLGIVYRKTSKKSDA